MKIMSSLQIMLLTILALALTIGNLPVRAQINTGNLFGTVRDNQGSALPGVTVTLTGPSGPPMVFVSDAQGRFRFLGLPPGQYSGKASLEGFSTVDRPGIDISVGRNTEVSITLTPADDEVISVTSESPLLLNDAIARANSDPNINAILIDTSGGKFTFNLTQPLPSITAPLAIINTGNNEAELNGANLGANAVGFDFVNTKGYLLGIKITGFQTGIRLTGPTGGTTITNCDIVNNRGDGVFNNGAPDTGIFNNTISKNQGNGITITDVAASTTRIQANLIGTDASGRTTDPDKIPASGDETGNIGEGIRAENSSGVVIGGTSPGDGNIVAGNGDGMSLINCRDFTIQGNYFGTNPRGDNLGNKGAGLGLAGNSSNNKIGGDVTTAFNYFAHNELGIIAFSGTSRNLFLFNRIYDNNRLGIDLNLDGVTANDPFGDSDTGANGLQNFPILTSAVATDADTTVRASLNSAANRDYKIQYFLSSESHSSGHGEGEHPLGSRVVTTNSTGFANADARISLPLPGGQFITALATDMITNDTSEFSPGVPVTGFFGESGLKITKSAPERANCTDSITYTITVMNAGTLAELDVIVADDLPSCLEREVKITTSQGFGVTLLNVEPLKTGVAFLGGLAPGASATITITGTLTENCGESISNKAFINEKISSMSVVTMVDCVNITGISVVGKNVFVSGSGFKKGDQIEINAEMRNTKFVDANTLNAKKGKKSLFRCDPANPTRMNLITLMRSSNTTQPILDTAAFATCP